VARQAKNDYLRKKAASDPHSWCRFRVLCSLPNVYAWYAAFGMQPGDKLCRAPAKRARIR